MGADVQLLNPYITINLPVEPFEGSSSLFPSFASPPTQRVSYSVNGMPIPVEYFMSFTPASGWDFTFMFASAQAEVWTHFITSRLS